MQIGITGLIGAGKTTAAKIFEKYGYKVINADQLYHKISKPSKIIYKKIVAEFGKNILNNDRTINREKLKKIVFSDDRKLKKLNFITHPIIISEIKKLIRKSKSKNIIVDAPLLLESKAKNLVDSVIVVRCSDKIRIKRLLKKGKHKRKEINKITKLQMAVRDKIGYADFVIENNGAFKDLEKQVKLIAEKFNSINKI